MSKNQTLTAAFIESAKPPQVGQACFWDRKVSGFGLRVSQGGRKSWVLLYRPKGQTNSRWLTLGTHPPLSLADARELAKDKLADIQKGGDPAADLRRSCGTSTFGELTRRYLVEWATEEKKESSKNEDERVINHDLLPAWEHHEAGVISRRDVRELVDRVYARGAKVQANRVLALISKLFNFAIDKDIVAINPAYKVKKPLQHEERRGRVLDVGEIRSIWKALETEPAVTAAMFKVLLLTGQRRGEVRGMCWAEIDLESGWWTIPGGRTGRAKNKLSHRVPLVGEGLRILRELHAAKSEKCDYVFVGRSGKRPRADLQKLIGRVIESSEVDGFRTHDLRRTVGTGLASLGTELTVIKKVLNHSEKGDVTAIYVRHGYDAEKRLALEKWDRRLHQIVTSRAPESNVVALRA
jgi:integrase